MRWTDATGGLADLVVHADPSETLGVAVFGRDDEDRRLFCEDVRAEVDRLLPAGDALRFDVDLTTRKDVWMWSAVMAGLVDGVGKALQRFDDGVGPESMGYRTFHDLNLVTEAVKAARKASATARERTPELKNAVATAGAELEVAEVRRAALTQPGSDVAREFATGDRSMAAILKFAQSLCGELRLPPVDAHGLSKLAKQVGGPHKQLWQSVRFALKTGGIWVLLVVCGLLWAGVTAWEVLPVTAWLGPKVVGFDMRPVGWALGWIVVAVVLSPGYKRAVRLRKLCKKGIERWARVRDKAAVKLDAKIEVAQAKLGKIQRKYDAARRVGAGEKEKVRQLQSGLGLGGFADRMLRATGDNMERWARRFDGARTDLEKIIARLHGEPRLAKQRMIVFLQGLDQRWGEASATFGVLRFLASLDGFSIIAPLDPDGLREAAYRQREDPRIEKSLMFMSAGARDFLATLAPQEALDRSFHLGVLAPLRREESPAAGLQTIGPLPEDLVRSCTKVAEGLTALAPSPHNRRRILSTLRWARSMASPDQQRTLGDARGDDLPTGDIQAVLLLSGILYGGADLSGRFFQSLAVTEHPELKAFIEADLRPESLGTKMSKDQLERWKGFCRKLLQGRDHAPGARQVDTLQRWSDLVVRAGSGSMPLVLPLPASAD